MADSSIRAPQPPPGTLRAGPGRGVGACGRDAARESEVREARYEDSEHFIETSRGQLRAKDVLVATNGYTGSPFPELRRRVVPVGSYIIATARLDPSVAARLIPRDRVLSDTKNLLYYFRLSPDRTDGVRRPRRVRPDVRGQAAVLLARAMAEVFPELAGANIEYAWGGQVAFTLDHMPHAGKLRGCTMRWGTPGTGWRCPPGSVPGWAMPLLVSDRCRAHGIVPCRPALRGQPWFLPLVGAYYRVKDLF